MTKCVHLVLNRVHAILLNFNFIIGRKNITNNFLYIVFAFAISGDSFTFLHWFHIVSVK